jgi:ParB/RepB/Spo0J family partition protein
MRYLETKEIPINEIDRNEYRLRQETRDKPLDNLMNSIKKIGLIHPVVVRVTLGQPAPYALVAGERRLEAHIRLGLEAIRADVWEATPEEAARPEHFLRAAEAMTIVSNVQVEPLDPFEEGRRYLRWINEGMTEEEVADMLDVSVARVRENVRPLRLIAPEVQEVIEANRDKIQSRHIQLLADEAERTPPEGQLRIVEFIMEQEDREVVQDPGKVPLVARAVRRQLRNERRQRQAASGAPKAAPDTEIFHSDDFKMKKLLQYLGEGEQVLENFGNAEVPGKISVVDVKSIESRCQRLSRGWQEAATSIVASIEKHASELAGVEAQPAGARE